MTTYKGPQSIRIASRNLSPDALHDFRFVLTVPIVVSLVNLVKAKCRTIVLPGSLDLNHPGSLFWRFLTSLNKTRAIAEFAPRSISRLTVSIALLFLKHLIFLEKLRIISSLFHFWAENPDTFMIQSSQQNEYVIFRLFFWHIWMRKTGCRICSWFL